MDMHDATVGYLKSLADHNRFVLPQNSKTPRLQNCKTAKLQNFNKTRSGTTAGIRLPTPHRVGAPQISSSRPQQPLFFHAAVETVVNKGTFSLPDLSRGASVANTRRGGDGGRLGTRSAKHSGSLTNETGSFPRYTRSRNSSCIFGARGCKSRYDAATSKPSWIVMARRMPPG